MSKNIQKAKRHIRFARKLVRKDLIATRRKLRRVRR